MPCGRVASDVEAGNPINDAALYGCIDNSAFGWPVAAVSGGAGHGEIMPGRGEKTAFRFQCATKEGKVLDGLDGDVAPGELRHLGNVHGQLEKWANFGICLEIETCPPIIAIHSDPISLVLPCANRSKGSHC